MQTDDRDRKKTTIWSDARLCKLIYHVWECDYFAEVDPIDYCVQVHTRKYICIQNVEEYPSPEN